ncbi:MAG: 4Fe-4S cluster-binding domain-containing protein [Ruminococcus bicirculans (ex Wegman et al. 2014)]
MNYHNITKDDMLNGDGLRTVLWVSGCNHHCKNCQNPQTWNRDSGIPFDFDTIFEICNQLDKSYISGITFSGGDPFVS